MNFYDYLTKQKETRNLFHIIDDVPNDIVKKCKYIVDELEIDPGLVFIDLEIAAIDKDYSKLEEDLVRLVEQKKSNTNNMCNILNKDIIEDERLIEKFSGQTDVDTTGYIDFLEKHKKETETEYKYLSFLLTRHIDWLRENS